jgi:hypothetical protein
LRLSLAECFRRGLDGAALLKQPASYQNKALVSLSRRSARKNRCVATRAHDQPHKKSKTARSPCPAHQKQASAAYSTAAIHNW